VRVQIHRAEDPADGELARGRLFQVSAWPDRAVAFMQYLRGHRAQQKAVESVAAGWHCDQVDPLFADRIHNFTCRIASEQQASDGNPIEFRDPQFVQILLRPLDDVRVQIPRRYLMSALQPSAWIAESASPRAAGGSPHESGTLTTQPAARYGATCREMQPEQEYSERSALPRCRFRSDLITSPLLIASFASLLVFILFEVPLLAVVLVMRLIVLTLAHTLLVGFVLRIIRALVLEGRCHGLHSGATHTNANR